MPYDLSVIIPVRNEFKNLLWTLQMLQLELTGLRAEVVCVLNQASDEEYERLVAYWPFQEGHMKAIRYDETGSAWQARRAGVAAATGEQLLFLDSHVVIRPGTLVRALDYKRTFEGVLHLAVNYWLNHPHRTVFQYKWQPEKFWGRWTREVPQEPTYNILMSGFCGLMMQRTVYDRVGGLHPQLGIYGGGEPYLDLKVQRYGYAIRCHPTLQLYHLTEKRGYSWNNDDLWRNFLLAASAVGGDKYAELLYNHYHRQCAGVRSYENRLGEIYEDAIAASLNDRMTIDREAVWSLDEVLDRYD